AEDGIRDDLVTGVQTCALPIYVLATDRVAGGLVPCPWHGKWLASRVPWPGGFARGTRSPACAAAPSPSPLGGGPAPISPPLTHRSEERRVGKECVARMSHEPSV